MNNNWYCGSCDFVPYLESQQNITHWLLNQLLRLFPQLKYTETTKWILIIFSMIFVLFNSILFFFRFCDAAVDGVSAVLVQWW